jgi:hypothetical protein
MINFFAVLGLYWWNEILWSKDPQECYTLCGGFAWCVVWGVDAVWSDTAKGMIFLQGQELRGDPGVCGLHWALEGVKRLFGLLKKASSVL